MFGKEVECIYCQTYDEAKAVTLELHSQGYTWPNKGSLKYEDNWAQYANENGATYCTYTDTVVRIGRGRYESQCPFIYANDFLSRERSSVYEQVSDEELLSLLGVSV